MKKLYAAKKMLILSIGLLLGVNLQAANQTTTLQEEDMKEVESQDSSVKPADYAQIMREYLTGLPGKGVPGGNLTPDLVSVMTEYAKPSWQSSKDADIDGDTFTATSQVLVAVSPDGTFILIARSGVPGYHSVMIFDASGNNALFDLVHTAAITCMTVSPQSNWIATGTQDKKAWIWNPNTSGLLHTLYHPEPVSSVAINETANIVVTGCADGKLRVWDLASGELLHTLWEENTSPVSSIAITPDGQIIVAGTKEAGSIWRLIFEEDTLLDHE